MNDEMWRVIYAMPILIAIIQILLFVCVFKEEPIAYAIGMERNEEAQRLMRRVYKKAEDQSDEEFEALVSSQFNFQR